MNGAAENIPLHGTWARSDIIGVRLLSYIMRSVLSFTLFCVVTKPFLESRSRHVDVSLSGPGTHSLQCSKCRYFNCCGCVLNAHNLRPGISIRSLPQPGNILMTLSWVHRVMLLVLLPPLLYKNGMLSETIECNMLFTNIWHILCLHSAVSSITMLGRIC